MYCGSVENRQCFAVEISEGLIVLAKHSGNGALGISLLVNYFRPITLVPFQNDFDTSYGHKKRKLFIKIILDRY